MRTRKCTLFVAALLTLSCSCGERIAPFNGLPNDDHATDAVADSHDAGFGCHNESDTATCVPISDNSLIEHMPGWWHRLDALNPYLLSVNPLEPSCATHTLSAQESGDACVEIHGWTVLILDGTTLRFTDDDGDWKIGEVRADGQRLEYSFYPDGPDGTPDGNPSIFTKIGDAEE